MHFYRDIFSYLPSTKIHDVARMLKAIDAEQTGKASEQKARMIREKLRVGKTSKMADIVGRAVWDTLVFPDAKNEFDHNCEVHRYLNLNASNGVDQSKLSTDLSCIRKVRHDPHASRANFSSRFPRWAQMSASF